jgi:hypothetical protein
MKSQVLHKRKIVVIILNFVNGPILASPQVCKHIIYSILLIYKFK